MTLVIGGLGRLGPVTERERERERIERWAAAVNWRLKRCGPVDRRRGSCVDGGLGRLGPVTLRPVTESLRERESD